MTGIMGKLRPILWLLISCGFCEITPINGATLSGEFTPVPQGEIVNLTAEGPLDWVHWTFRGQVYDFALRNRSELSA